MLRYGSRPGLNGLDDLLSAYLDFDGGFFVEAGANDGYEQSNTYRLEVERGWTGLLVEGIPELARRCERLRRRSKVVNCALVDDDYPSSTVTMHFADLMSVVGDTYGGADRALAHVEEGLETQHLRSSYAVEVPARTLKSILVESDINHIDFFSLDVEGYELNVLKGLDLSIFRPRLLLVEWTYGEVGEFLESNDYAHIGRLTHHDHLFRDRRS